MPIHATSSPTKPRSIVEGRQRRHELRRLPRPLDKRPRIDAHAVDAGGDRIMARRRQRYMGRGPLSGKTSSHRNGAGASSGGCMARRTEPPMDYLTAYAFAAEAFEQRHPRETWPRGCGATRCVNLLAGRAAELHRRVRVEAAREPVGLRLLRGEGERLDGRHGGLAGHPTRHVRPRGPRGVPLIRAGASAIAREIGDARVPRAIGIGHPPAKVLIDHGVVDTRGRLTIDPSRWDFEP